MTMDLKDQLNKAVSALKNVAESEKVRSLTTKAKETAVNLAKQVRQGAVSAADAFVEANADASTIRLRHLKADISVVSPSDGLQISRPRGGTLVISDGAGNSLVINATAETAQVAETVGTVKRLADNTYDVGPEDGVNVVVLKA
jgi:hypothetical protein